MADLTNVVKYFPVPNETYTNNLSASISAGAVTVPVNANNVYADGDVVVLTVEPGTTNEATFTGVKASSPARFTNCVWTEGNLGVGHASGVTITDYDSATHVGMMTKGIKKFANDDGTLKTTAVQAALNISSAVPSDYTSLAQTATTVTALGNRSYSMLFPGVNYTDRINKGMRLRAVRTTDVNGQSADFESTSLQYATKAAPTGHSFTDDWTMEAWIKVESKTGNYQYIMGRRSGAPGYGFALNGSLQLFGFANNGSAEDAVTCNQSIPVGKWTHVALTWDMSASAALFYIDGNVVPGVYTTNSAAVSVGQAGDFRIAANTNAGTENFDGLMKEVRLWSTVRTAAQIKDNMSQAVSPSSTGLVGYWKMDGNFNDSTANANHLTAVNGAIATSANAPWATQASGIVSPNVEYGIVQDITYTAPDTTMIVQVPEGCLLPTSGGISSVSYSQFKAPYQFPTSKFRWRVSAELANNIAVGSALASTQNMGMQLIVPAGDWTVGYEGIFEIYSSTSSLIEFFFWLGQTSNFPDYSHLALWCYQQAVLNYYVTPSVKREGNFVFTTPTTMTIYQRCISGAGTVQGMIIGANSTFSIYADNTLL